MTQKKNLMLMLTLNIKGEEKNASAEGDGAVDAAFNAIKNYRS